MKMEPYFSSNDGAYVLYAGDVCDTLHSLDTRPFDMIFADPPYFLSNGGFSVQAGRCVSVNKGNWDKSNGMELDRLFTVSWLKACRNLMADTATIWVCGTYHNIFTVAEALTELKFKILNVITWQKTNPPPNLSCRYFTHSTEFLIWARKHERIAHRYNYETMRKIAGGRQMTDVWRMPAIAPWEKTCGKHPAQKPISLVARAMLSCSEPGDAILDPFAGSGTTGIAANLLSRRFVGVERECAFLNMAANRRQQLNDMREIWLSKLPDLKMLTPKGDSAEIMV